MYFMMFFSTVWAGETVVAQRPKETPLYEPAGPNDEEQLKKFVEQTKKAVEDALQPGVSRGDKEKLIQDLVQIRPNVTSDLQDKN